MKRFYGLLFAITALISGTAYGMEVNIRDYADVMEHLITTADFRADDEFEDLAIMALPAIENFIIANHLQDEKQYINLCLSYLNKVFALRECDAQQVEKMLKGRFIGDSEKALYYAGHKQFVVGKLQLDKLHPVITDVCTSKDTDAILGWLLLFDGTDNMCETMLVRDGLCQVIPAKKGLATSMQPEERVLLQKAKDLQGQGKEFIDTLREKDQEDKNERLRQRANAEKNKDDIVARIFNDLKASNRDAQLDQLLQDQLVGDDAPFGEYRDYINEQIQARLNHPRLINNRENLLNRWNDTFAKLPVMIKSEPAITVDTNPLGNPVIDQTRKPKGIAALFAAITAPKLALMAVVVGVGYWGYTKYKMYKAAQESDAVAQEDKKKEQKEAENKQNVTNKQHVRKQPPVRKQRAR